MPRINGTDKKELLGFIKQALVHLYEQDIYLFEKRVHERTIVFRFGVYLNNVISASGSGFGGYHVDCEYNRDSSKVKRCPDPSGTNRQIFPDLIIHCRGSDENLCAIEFKTPWNKKNENDIGKLKELTKQNGRYTYALGLSIVFGKEFSETQVIRVEDGDADNQSC